jgi:membrane-associated protease RseP (regulator of RpoE activity)
MLPTTQTTRTNVSGNVSGTGGSAYYSGSGTSTTNGSQAVYMPFSVDRHEYFASYWIKRKGVILGIEPRDINDKIRSEIGSNMGILVNVVIKNTPAFFAGLFKGDVITSIGDKLVYNPQSLNEALSENAGKEVDVLFFRDGKRLTKKIKLNKLDI